VDDNHPYVRVSIEALQGGAERGRHVGVDRVVHVRTVEGQQADGTPALDEQGPGCWRGDGTVGYGHPASLAANGNETETRTGEITLAVLRSTQQGDTISGRRSVRFPHEEYHVTERRTTTFDHHGAELPHGSHDIYAEMRGTCPVAWTDAHGGYWIVTGADEVGDASRDYELFTSEHDTGTHLGVTIPAQPKYSGMIESDPPYFTVLRKAVTPWFSPNAAKAAAPDIRRLTDWAIDQIIERGAGDLTLDVATPIPAMQTMMLLGLPLKESEWLADLFHRETCTPPNSPDRPQVHADILRLHETLHHWTVERRAHPGDDFLSFLATAEFDGKLMPVDEVRGNAFLMLAGGVDTTTALLSHTFVHLQQDRAARRFLIEDFSRLPLACEEYLRWVTPVQGMARTVTRDCEFGGQPLRKDDRVWISWASANLAPELFDEPEQIKLDRSPNRHSAFGLGIHRCLGSNLARVVWRIVVEQVLRRMPDYELDLSAAERYPSIGITNGWKYTPVTFTPGSKVGAEL
jgi:cytochrome P450